MLVDVVCFLKNFRSVCLLFFGGGTSVQSSSVQSRDRLGRRGDMRDDSAEILLHFVLFFPPRGGSIRGSQNVLLSERDGVCQSSGLRRSRGTLSLCDFTRTLRRNAHKVFKEVVLNVAR